MFGDGPQRGTLSSFELMTSSDRATLSAGGEVQLLARGAALRLSVLSERISEKLDDAISEG